MNSQASQPQARTQQDSTSRGWLTAIKQLADQARLNQLPVTAAGVAFFAMLGLLPALIALVTVYALVADPQALRRQLDPVLAAVPTEAVSIVERQLQSVAAIGQGGLTFGLLLSVLVLLWSASVGMRGLIAGVNRAHNRQERRGFLHRQALALALSLVAIVVTAVALVVIAVLPLLIGVLGLGDTGRWVVLVGRWAAILVLVAIALAALYRYGPDRDQRNARWTSPGVVVAIVLWLIGSLAFSFYVDRFAAYQVTYGALSSVIVLMLWLYICCVAVLLGAEVDARRERHAGRGSDS